MLSEIIPTFCPPANPEPPHLIAWAGKGAALRFLEFFTVNIRNRNTRAAYARAGKLGVKNTSPAYSESGLAGLAEALLRQGDEPTTWIGEQSRCIVRSGR
jgi:hypothetical protein